MSTTESELPDSDEALAAEAESLSETEELEATEAAEIEDSAQAGDEAASFEPFEQLAARGADLTAAEVRRVIQSLLLVSDRPLAVAELHETTAIPEVALAEGLQALAGEWREGESGIVLAEVAEGWQLRTEPASAEYVRRLLRVKPQRLTRPALETLAVVAYRQPVTRPEVEDVRGVDCGAVLKALLERRLVKILGKKEDVGRPLLYGTTREFLQFFALKDLNGLPTLREFQELSEEHQALLAKKDQPRPSPEGTIEALEDPAFRERIESQQKASEEALGELEVAMSTAEARARAAAEALKPPEPEAPKAP